MTSWLLPSQIAQVFADEMKIAGGMVTNSYEDETRLFARSVLPPSIDVGIGDRLQGGVAIRATDTDIFIHPYVFRLVCTNGAIMARSTQTRHIPRDEWFLRPGAQGDLESTVRDAVCRCCAAEAFITAAGQMRSAQDTAADMAINIAAFTAGHRGAVPDSMIAEILRRYDRAADPSAYGLMNAVTSLARDIRDPAMKWRMEELGGGIPAIRNTPIRTPSVTRTLRREPVAVG